MPRRENQDSVYRSKGSAKFEDTRKPWPFGVPVYREESDYKNVVLKEYVQRKTGRGGLFSHHAPHPHTLARSTSCRGLHSTPSLRSLGGHNHFPFLCYYATQPVTVPEDVAR